MSKRLRAVVVCTLAFVAVPFPAPSAFAQNNSLTFDLEWNSSADLDLMVEEPDGTWIDYDDPSSASGGTLDASQGNNFCEDTSPTPREGVSWLNNAPTGTYWIDIAFFDACGATEAQSFTLTITSNGQVIEQIQSVVFAGEGNTRVFNFIYPDASIFSALAEDNAPEASGALGGILGGTADKPTATPASLTGQLEPQAGPKPSATPLNTQPTSDANTGPIEMGSSDTIDVPRGPLRVQLTWPSVPDFDLDLMAKELGTMISYDEPISASGGMLSEDFGNSFCASQPLPDHDMYGEEIAWSTDPLGSTLEVYVAFIGICGPSGFVLPGDEIAHFTLAVYDAQGQALYGPVEGATDIEGRWGVTLRFTE
ncbi:hypothetical protein [Aggregatilinea lenta]|uniref:hypothetical protein n=1 Tax=Aggregatilinea lenta TaxID=913108 RepID=UPI000E5C5412|nr:hypothetical protein [Aggregatilinea lenta]